MKRSARSKIAVVSGVLAFVAAGAFHCQARTFTTCAGICAGVPPCNESYDDCLMRCTTLEDKCTRVGHPGAFLAYLICTTDGGLSCDEAGQPVASALCEHQQADLVECESEGDAALDIPDGAFEADTPCADAGDCTACCKEHHLAGAQMYATLVTECTCAPGVCRSPCAKESCAGDAQMQPEAGDKCDQCLGNALNDLTPDASACLIPVTLQCNQNADCALYVNCATQAGCEP